MKRREYSDCSSVYDRLRSNGPPRNARSLRLTRILGTSAGAEVSVVIAVITFW